MVEKSFNAGAVKIAALDNQGAGQVVIGLHGYLDNAASMQALAPHLTSYRYIAIDLAGHGHSSHRPIGAYYNQTDYLQDHIHHAHLSANLGYWLRPDACGRGLATAICNALKKLAFSQMNLHRLECFVEPNNKASLRVAERIGAIKEGLCRKRVFGRDALLYALVND